MEYRGLGLNDMAKAVGSYYTDQQGNHVHVYLGNTKIIWFGGLLNELIGYPGAMAHIIQNHSNHDLEHALIYGPDGTIELKAVWGDDADRDGFLDNTLQWWPLDSRLDWINFF